jgi:hypothetical protein
MNMITMSVIFALVAAAMGYLYGGVPGAIGATTGMSFLFTIVGLMMTQERKGRPS